MVKDFAIYHLGHGVHSVDIAMLKHIKSEILRWEIEVVEFFAKFTGSERYRFYEVVPWVEFSEKHFPAQGEGLDVAVALLSANGNLWIDSIGIKNKSSRYDSTVLLHTWGEINFPKIHFTTHTEPLEFDLSTGLAQKTDTVFFRERFWDGSTIDHYRPFTYYVQKR
jgi:hypothetical protein